MGILKNLKSSLSESMEFIPKEVYVAFWLSGFLKIIGFGAYTLWLDYITFLVMSVIIMNYYLKGWAYKIRNYADGVDKK